MLQEVNLLQRFKRLDREAWHKPVISIVITHFNYAHHIEGAILSLLDQTYENWKCVIVDDASSSEQREKLAAIVGDIDDRRFRLVMRSENEGQIPAFFAGLDETDGEFVCLLDPDDRYAATFLEEALACHLNEVVYCPIACTEQMLLGKGSVVTGIYGWHNRARSESRDGAMVIAPLTPQLLYHAAGKRGWFWTSTSAMMFRRAALGVLRPRKVLAYKGSFDSYMAQGAHLLGGTLFYTKPLVYRGLHDDNAWITANVYASAQDKKKTYGEERTKECLADVTEAIRLNGAIPPTSVKKKGLLAKWKRSFDKRWRR